MNKKPVVICSAYLRKDVDWTILSYAVSVKDSKYANSDKWYIYRYDFSKKSFEEVFGHYEEKDLNNLVWKTAYINESLSMK